MALSIPPSSCTTRLVLRRLTKENDRYKVYLPKKYNDIWEKLYKEGKRVDLLLILKY